MEQSGEPVALAGGVQVTPIGVPHRAEYTDTYGYVMAGARQRVLYIPDTSPWHASHAIPSSAMSPGAPQSSRS